MQRGDVQRDVGPGVAGAHDEDPAIAELRRVPVCARVELHDLEVQLPGEGGDPWVAVGPEATITLSASIRSRPAEDVPVAVARDPIDMDARPDGQTEPGGVGLQVIDHLVPRRAGPPLVG